MFILQHLAFFGILTHHLHLLVEDMQKSASERPEFEELTIEVEELNAESLSQELLVEEELERLAHLAIPKFQPLRRPSRRTKLKDAATCTCRASLLGCECCLSTPL